MKLSLGFSPCPNDTFIFDALVNNKIDRGDLELELFLEDIQTLNEWGAEGRLDITKLSFPAFFASDNYDMLSSGAALGKGVGPLLVARKMVDVPEVSHAVIAIPGYNTTANFLLNYAFPEAKNKVPMLFSKIEDAVVNKEVDMGVIIHENRFTYHAKGLHKICDLGEIWEEREKLPIPLACIAAKKSLPDEVKRKVENLIRQSLELAFSKYPELSSFTKDHAQAMDEQVMRQHIDLYVNDYSLNLGEEGLKAINRFGAIIQKEEKETAASFASQLRLPEKK